MESKTIQKNVSTQEFKVKHSERGIRESDIITGIANQVRYLKSRSTSNIVSPRPTTLPLIKDIYEAGIFPTLGSKRWRSDNFVSDIRSKISSNHSSGLMPFILQEPINEYIIAECCAPS